MEKDVDEDKNVTKDKDVEVVDISSDSDLEDEEFRRIFANVDANLGFDTSDITDTEDISSLVKRQKRHLVL